ncbi:hypothetical protein Misp03_56530 [Microbispora sp. NBRC 16548]|nr:hypothetical protein Misp03_56530 [Microbispora sp. NBRC 16548]
MPGSGSRRNPHSGYRAVPLARAPKIQHVRSGPATARALARLEQVLPSRLRHHVGDLRSVTVPLAGRAATVDPAAPTAIAGARSVSTGCACTARTGRASRPASRPAPTSCIRYISERISVDPYRYRGRFTVHAPAAVAAAPAPARLTRPRMA